jgi:hypothetical protein
VHLERDTANDGALAGYIVTSLVRSVVRRISVSLEKEAQQRAWSVTGAYGTGKTAMAVLLANLLCDSKDGRKSKSRQLVAAADAELSNRLQSLVPAGRGYVPVLATGERNSIDVVLLAALRDAVEQFTKGRGAKPAVLGQIEAALARCERGKRVPVREVVELFEETARKLASSSGRAAGLLVILDEAGKCLEFASQNPAAGDVQLLQGLAEASNRSGNAPMVFVTILHQAIERYATRLGAAQRNEWAKVQGRFEDIAFQEDVDQLLKLVASAIESTRPLPPKARDEFDALATHVADVVAAGDKRRRDSLRDDLCRAFPLHPVTALVVGALFRSRLAQNERSLFSFLCSGEPLGFGAHLESEFDPKAPLANLYAPDQLYDYVVSALGPQLYGADGRQWAEVDTALRRLPRGAGQVAVRVLKTIGLLSIVGDSVGARASTRLLNLCLGAAVGEEAGAITAEIENLVRASLIVYRRYRDAYQIWEGSDLDVEHLVKTAHDQTDTRAELPSRLMALLPPRPVVARRHLFQTGTLRYFEVRYVDASDLRAAFKCVPQDGADGLLLIAVPRTGSDAAVTRERSRDMKLWNDAKAPILVGVPRSADHLLDLAADLAALEWVSRNTPELVRDAVARREVLSRLSEAQRLVEYELARLIEGDSQTGCEWFYEGERLAVRSAADLSRQVSKICDQVFHHAPEIQNELINRRSLSSAAAAARRNLLEAMLESADKPNLGFVGYPPEVSMYVSLLQPLGLHRKIKGELSIAPPLPTSSASAAWKAIAEFLDSTEQRRRTLAELYALLGAPPFGIKEAPVSILTWAALIHFEPEVALFEEGSFVPGLSVPSMERMLRWPEKFEVQRFRIAGVRAQVFARFGRALTASGDADQPTLLSIVKSLVKFVADLPDYARSTRRLSGQAQEVRNALIRAKEPAPLLFRDLPQACGFAPFEATKPKGDDKDVEQFFVSLRRSLGELQNAYPSLMEVVSKLLCDAFELTGADWQARFATRAHPLIELAGEPELKAFLMRAADDLPCSEWLVSLATYLATKPPTRWNDGDFEVFQQKLTRLVPRFRAIESVAIELSRTGQSALSLVRLCITRPRLPELERVISVTEGSQPLVESLRQAIMEAIDKVHNSGRHVALAALAEAVQQLLERRPHERRFEN